MFVVFGKSPERTMQDVTEYVIEDKKCIFLNYDLFQIKFYFQLLVKLFTKVYLNLAGSFIPHFNAME